MKHMLATPATATPLPEAYGDLPASLRGPAEVVKFPETPSGRAPLRITFVSPPPDGSGGQRVIAIHADRLARRGHEVTIVCYGRPKPRLRSRIKARILGRPATPEQKLVHYRGGRARIVQLDHAGPVTAADLPDADVVIATWWKTAPWVAGLPPSKGEKVYFMQDYGAPGQEFDKLIPTWKLPFRFVTLTGDLARRIAEHAGHDRIHVVRNAVDTAEFHAKPGGYRARRIGFIHKSLPTKGAATAVGAMCRVRDRHPEIELLAVGTAPRPADLPDSFIHIEAPDDRTLRDIYASTAVWLCPSAMEGFGLPVLEAMACRTPVVSTRVGVAPDIIRDGENGFLCDPGDTDSMTRALLRAITLDEDRWTRLSENARQSVLGYSWEDAVTGFEAALYAALPAQASLSARARM